MPRIWEDFCYSFSVQRRCAGSFVVDRTMRPCTIDADGRRAASERVTSAAPNRLDVNYNYPDGFEAAFTAHPY